MVRVLGVMAVCAGSAAGQIVEFASFVSLGDEDPGTLAGVYDASTPGGMPAGDGVNYDNALSWLAWREPGAEDFTNLVPGDDLNLVGIIDNAPPTSSFVLFPAGDYFVVSARASNLQFAFYFIDTSGGSFSDEALPTSAELAGASFDRLIILYADFNTGQFTPIEPQSFSFFLIPAPGPAAVLAGGLALACRRRRGGA